jgi:hypothetical protein
MYIHVVSHRRLSVSLIALTLVAASNCVPADMAADIAASGLSADEAGLIETQSCRAWHARPITGLRSELIGDTSNLRVSVECEFHGEYQGNRLGSVGVCEGSGTTWDCKSVGTLIELSFSARQRSAILYDIPLPEGIELMRFLERESAKGHGLAADDSPGTIVQLFAPIDSRYLARIEYIGIETSIHVDKRCTRRGCKFKLGDTATYQNFNDF